MTLDDVRQTMERLVELSGQLEQKRQAELGRLRTVPNPQVQTAAGIGALVGQQAGIAKGIEQIAGGIKVLADSAQKESRKTWAILFLGGVAAAAGIAGAILVAVH